MFKRFKLRHMTEELLVKYKPLLDEFNPNDEFEKGERAGLAAFLNRPDMTEKRLDEMVEIFKSGLENGKSYDTFVNDPEYHWITYVEAFKRKGTIHSHSTKKIVALVRADRPRLAAEYLKKQNPLLFKEIYGGKRQ